MANPEHGDIVKQSADAIRAWREQNPGVRLAELQNLAGRVTGLDLSDTEFTYAGLEHLKWCTQLQTLDLKGTKVTDAGLVHLQGLLQLQTLDMTHTEVTDAGLAHLRALTQLQTL